MVILKGFPFLVAKISNNRLVPENFEHSETWHRRAGGFAPLWMRKLAHGDKKFWRPEDEVRVALPIPTKDGKETDSPSSQEKNVGISHQIIEISHDKKYDAEMGLYLGKY